MPIKQDLDPPFEIKGDEKVKDRITAMINTAVKSETGRETLETASKAGYTLGMEFAFGCNGGCSKENKVIILNPIEKDETLIGVLVHESRHAGQFERGEYDACDDRRARTNTLKHNIMRTRAVEADAQATAAQALGELFEAGIEEPLLSFCRQPANRTIAAAFNRACYAPDALKDGSARTAAFLGWYDNEAVRTAYDNVYQIDMMERRAENGKSIEDTYATTQSGAKIVKDLCVKADGSCYFTEDPKILETQDYAGTTPAVATKLDTLMKAVPNARKSAENVQPFKAEDNRAFMMKKMRIGR